MKSKCWYWCAPVFVCSLILATAPCLVGQEAKPNPVRQKNGGKRQYKTLRVIPHLLVNGGAELSKKQWGKVTKLDRLHTKMLEDLAGTEDPPTEQNRAKDAVFRSAAAHLQRILPLKAVRVSVLPADLRPMPLGRSLASVELTPLQRLALLDFSREHQRIQSFVRKSGGQLSGDFKSPSLGEQILETHQQSVMQEFKILLSPEQRSKLFGDSESPLAESRQVYRQLMPDSNYDELSIGERYSLAEIAKWLLPVNREIRRQNRELKSEDTTQGNTVMDEALAAVLLRAQQHALTVFRGEANADIGGTTDSPTDIIAAKDLPPEMTYSQEIRLENLKSELQPVIDELSRQTRVSSESEETDQDSVGFRTIEEVKQRTLTHARHRFQEILTPVAATESQTTDNKAEATE